MVDEDSQSLAVSRSNSPVRSWAHAADLKFRCKNQFVPDPISCRRRHGQVRRDDEEEKIDIVDIEVARRESWHFLVSNSQ